MTIPSVLSFCQDSSSDGSRLPLEERVNKPSISESNNLKVLNSTFLQLHASGQNASVLKQTAKELSILPEQQKFIKDFVASFLHPYITGQITTVNEPPNRKSLVELLLEKMPKFEPSKRDEVIELAFQAYLNTAVLGLYVNRLIMRGTVTPDTTEFDVLLYALEKSIPKDFCEKKLSFSELKVLAVETLIKVNHEKIRMDEDAKKHNYEFNCGQLLKFNVLKQSGKLFLDKQTLVATPQKSINEHIEQDLLDVLQNPTEEKINGIKNQLQYLEFRSSPEDINNQAHIANNLSTWKTLAEIVNLFMQMKKHDYKHNIHELNFLQEDLSARYQEYLAKGRKDPKFKNFINDELNIIKLIDKITEAKELLGELGLYSCLIDLYFHTLEDVYWNTLNFIGPFEEQENADTRTSYNLERYTALVEALQLLLPHSTAFAGNVKLKDALLDLVEDCMSSNTIHNNEMKNEFMKFF